VDIKQLIGQKLMLAFEGKQAPSAEIVATLRNYQPAGLTLFRDLNIDRPEQVRGLTDALQHLAHDDGLPPLLIAADQEGGQLMAVGEGVTQLPGNMALGAAGAAELSRRAGEVLGRELAAMGINVLYAPVCDVNVNPHNPVIGIRSFGERPEDVAGHAAAMVEGIQSHGVAATAKHFPGHGDTSTDSHLGFQTVPHSKKRLQTVELPPFRAAIRAGCKLIMSAHIGLPAIDRDGDIPATLSYTILGEILREEMRFPGVIISDAMDMQAVRQGSDLGEQAVKAVSAGIDLLLLTNNPDDHQRVHDSLLQALQKGALDRDALEASVGRILSLKSWLKEHTIQPEPDVIGCAEHLAVAVEIAERSITLVRDQANLLPLIPSTKQRIAVVLPEPRDLTPADTSSTVSISLADAMRVYHPHVDEFVVPHAPDEIDFTELRQHLGSCDLILLGTIDAFGNPEWARFVKNVLSLGVSTIVVALRLPYDLAAFPEARTYLCTYGILAPSMQALAKALFGQIPFMGSLPVSIPDLYPTGYSE
jgi:beta-N-acetylhexosaminidase